MCLCVCVCVCACVRVCACVCVCVCVCPTFEVEVQDIIQLRGGVQFEFLAYFANNLRSHSVAAVVRRERR